MPGGLYCLDGKTGQDDKVTNTFRVELRSTLSSHTAVG